jgi:hypothetical protein
MTKMKRYLIINNKYYYEDYNTDRTLLLDSAVVMNEVAICFDRDSHFLLEHGKPEDVMKYYKDTVERFKKAGLFVPTRDLMIISAKFSVRELNKLMLDPHYITGFIENNKQLFVRDIRENE